MEIMDRDGERHMGAPAVRRSLFTVQERTVGDIDGLGYLGLTGSVPAWREFAGILGLQTAPREPIERCASGWTSGRGGSPSKRGTGHRLYRLGGPDAVESHPGQAHRRRLRRSKTDPELAAERNVLEVFSCEDPSGFRLEFFFGPEVSSEPFVSPTGARFVTSIGRTAPWVSATS